ncbi:hypothetical protein BJ970_002334 [Saccharopolyspora phatthalungensis]|uniref:Uncharacterized protein n=1 Tax=Saccharopolyspora phatthalungensis TaxID=664693 RepID=A0A840Q4H8_9PSEU|nr:hypothetical protein [Saccharopolyspora phatthalungensis]
MWITVPAAFWRTGRFPGEFLREPTGVIETGSALTIPTRTTTR